MSVILAFFAVTRNDLSKMDGKKKSRERKCYKCGCGESFSVSLHKFPVDKDLRKAWADFCNVDVACIKQHFKLCSNHFPLSCFKARNPEWTNVGSKGRCYLKKDAVPSIINGWYGYAVSRNNGNSKEFEAPGMEKKKNCCVLCGLVESNLQRFIFPKDLHLRALWLHACGLQQAGFKDGRLCEIHFSPDDFELSTTRRRLRKGAVPSRLLPSQVTETSIPNGAQSTGVDGCSSFILPHDVVGSGGTYLEELVEVTIADASQGFEAAEERPPPTSSEMEDDPICLTDDVSESMVTDPLMDDIKEEPNLSLGASTPASPADPNSITTGVVEPVDTDQHVIFIKQEPDLLASPYQDVSVQTVETPSVVSRLPLLSTNSTQVTPSLCCGSSADTDNPIFKRFPRYVSDISMSQCGSSKIAKIILDVAQRDILNNQKRCKKLRQENFRLKKKVQKLTDSLEQLRSRYAQ